MSSIYYTIDGSIPTASSTLYTSSLLVALDTTVTIKAIVVKDGLSSSVVSMKCAVIDYPYLSIYNAAYASTRDILGYPIVPAVTYTYVSNHQTVIDATILKDVILTENIADSTVLEVNSNIFLLTTGDKLSLRV